MTDNPGDTEIVDPEKSEGRDNVVAVQTDVSMPVESTANGGELPPEDDGRVSLLRKRRGRSIIEWVAVLVAALLIALGLRTFAFQVFYVPSSSMVPELAVGDRIVVDKFLFNYHSLHEGDIIVFAQPLADTMCGPDETDLVKRVIGLPGQTISESSSGKVLINGKVLKEPYLPKNDPLGPEPIKTQKIPPNHFFVLGDNRSISCDSRYWGTVSGPTIVGKVVAIIWRNNHPYLHVF